MPTVDYEQSYRSYIDELGDAERHPFMLDSEFDDFSALVARLNDCSLGIDLPDGTVPHTTYWLVEGGEIVGVSSLRHHMTERLRLLGGLSQVLVICLKENIASSKVIEASGGTLESEYSVPEYAGPLQRFHFGF